MGCCQSRPIEPPKAPIPAAVTPPPVDSDASPVPKVKKQQKSRSPSVVPASTPDAKKTTSKNFECEKNHPLTWHVDIPFRYESINFTWTIRCDNCSNVYTGAGYHCNQCNYNLCDICCKDYDKPRQVLYCEAKHELIWSPETIWKHKSADAEEGFMCDKCGDARREPAWSCEICEYDICLKCAQIDGFDQPQEFFRCKTSNHALDYVLKEDDEKNEHSCDICTNTISNDLPRMSCKAHNFDVCMDCANKRLYEMLPHPGFKCREGKNLRIQNRATVVEETGDKIVCNVCENAEFELGYICEGCLTCYCLNCSGKIHRGILNCHKKTCDEGHRLVWVFCSNRESKNYVCNICKGKKTCGAFACNDCNYHICIKDFSLE